MRDILTKVLDKIQTTYGDDTREASLRLRRFADRRGLGEATAARLLLAAWAAREQMQACAGESRRPGLDELLEGPAGRGPRH